MIEVEEKETGEIGIVDTIVIETIIVTDIVIVISTEIEIADGEMVVGIGETMIPIDRQVIEI